VTFVLAVMTAAAVAVGVALPAAAATLFITNT
jgi:hypothetical protein